MDYQKTIVILVLAVVLDLSQSAFVDTLTKCKLADSECHKAVTQNALQSIAETGIPEFDIAPLDPIQLKDTSVSILNIFDFKLLEGTAEGIRNCVFNDFQRNIETLHVSIDVTCDVVIKGKYQVRSLSEEIKKLFGGDIHGDGNGQVDIEQVNVKLEYPFVVEKRGDDIYLNGDLDKRNYTIDVLGNLTFTADNLYLGDKESSAEITNLLNQNWKLLVGSYGNAFFEVAFNVVSSFIKKVFDQLSAKYYILDDLTPYLS